MASESTNAQAPYDPLAFSLRLVLQGIGEDPNRDGLRDTPKRVVKAWKEFQAGHEMNPAEILATNFSETSDEPIVVRGIEFASLCEHHLMPFIGHVDIAYLPDGGVVGLSKLARLVECFSRRFQIQERLTGQIAESIEKHLKAKGVAVIVESHHSCMGCRGVRKPSATMVTADYRGEMKQSAVRRAELLALLCRK